MALAAQQARRVAADEARIPRFDYWLVASVIVLATLGLVMVSSASITFADREVGQPFYYAFRQLVYIGVGVLAGFLLFKVRLVDLERLGMLLLLSAFTLLLLVLVPGIGIEVNGASRWVSAGLFRMQVSEPAKLLFIIYLASYLARHGEEVRSHISGFIKPVALLAIAALLLLLEPDFGAAVVLTAMVMGMIFMAGVRLIQFSGVLGAAGLLLASLAVSSPYRMNRLTTFMDPWADPFNSGFQLTQSLIAIGRGEWFGVGLGDGVQKLFYLPEAHTDFVFAVFAEEFGLLGSVALIVLFLALLWRVFKLAMRAADSERFFEAYLAIGLGTWLGLQAFINIGVNMGTLPTKGLTLPLISYGRSSLIVAMVAIGLLLRIHHELVVDAKPVNRKRRRKK